MMVGNVDDGKSIFCSRHGVFLNYGGMCSDLPDVATDYDKPAALYPFDASLVHSLMHLCLFLM